MTIDCPSPRPAFARSGDIDALPPYKATATVMIAFTLPRARSTPVTSSRALFVDAFASPGQQRAIGIPVTLALSRPRRHAMPYNIACFSPTSARPAAYHRSLSLARQRHDSFLSARAAMRDDEHQGQRCDELPRLRAVGTTRAATLGNAYYIMSRAQRQYEPGLPARAIIR